jgi:Domain of unknown function (4846)
MGSLVLLLAVYAFPHAAGDEPLLARFAPPAGARRVAVADVSFGDFLRHLPLLPRGTAVRLWNGALKSRQDVHAAVVDLDVPPRDLQQCADTIMRLWAEYRFGRRLPAAFHPDPGNPRALVYRGPYGERDRPAFMRWMTGVFGDAGSASLQAELPPVSSLERTQPLDVRPGDVLIQGGYPGHAVIVLDVAVADDGRRWLLLGQSYMPAQQLHVLVNPAAPSPWYDAAALTSPAGLRTPEWRPFFARDLRRFAGD